MGQRWGSNNTLGRQKQRLTWLILICANDLLPASPLAELLSWMKANHLIAYISPRKFVQSNLIIYSFTNSGLWQYSLPIWMQSLKRLKNLKKTMKLLCTRYAFMMPSKMVYLLVGVILCTLISIAGVLQKILL